MSLGPVEELVVKFPGNQFKGEIIPALHQLIDTGIVRIIDIAFVHKDEGGNVTNIELDERRTSELTGIAPGHYVLLTVADTGSGMSEEIRSHLFEPFFTTKDGRAGLGLSTVYGIVQQSNGHIVVDTWPEMGTMFQIYLPRVQP